MKKLLSESKDILNYIKKLNKSRVLNYSHNINYKI